VEPPEAVRRKAAAHGAAAWLDALPDLVAGLERDWDLTAGRVFGDATEACVLEATLADGTAAVLKLVVPRDGDAAAHEITTLRLADGDGCVRLLRDDVARGALLLERLGTPLNEAGLPVGRRHEILCDLARRFWRPAPRSGLPTGAAKGAWLAAFIATTWESLGRPCPERTVAHAVACAERRAAAHDDDRAVLVHGDLHQWNTLRRGDGWALVDPDGLLAEAEYDLGIVMREDPVELLAGDPRDRARWLASRTGRDAVATWEWGAAERVSTGLLCLTIGLLPVGPDMLAAADRIAAEFPALG